MEKEEDSCYRERYCHVYNRGVGKNNIFADNLDRRRFLYALYVFNNRNTVGNFFWQLERDNENISFEDLKHSLRESNIDKQPLVNVLAYCLKDNHFHLLLKELERGGIATFMHRIGSGYARYFNGRHNRKGVFFEGRYRCKEIKENSYLCSLLMYINVINPLQEVFLNLKKEGVDNFKKARCFVDNYSWSSQKEYLCKRREDLIEKDIFTDIFKSKKEYCSFVDDVLESKRSIWHAESVFLE